MILEIQKKLSKKAIDEKYEYLSSKDNGKSYLKYLKIKSIEIILAKRNKQKSLFGEGNAFGFDFLFYFHILNVFLQFAMIFATIWAEGAKVSENLTLFAIFGVLSIINLSLSYYAKKKIKGSIITSLLASLLSFNIFIILANFLVMAHSYNHPFLKLTKKEKMDCLEKAIYIENNKNVKLEDLNFD